MITALVTVILLAMIVYCLLKIRRNLDLIDMHYDIERLERELDLDDTYKVKQPPAPKPQKIER